jgi:hypothetical protein
MNESEDGVQLAERVPDVPNRIGALGPIEQGVSRALVRLDVFGDLVEVLAERCDLLSSRP